VTARAYFGASYSVTSAPVGFTVGTPPEVVAGVSLQGTNQMLNWSGCAAWYQVQMATNLGSPVWQNLGPLSTNMSLAIAPTNRAAFYRVIKQ
jgi:hypothetical protein